VASQDLSGQQIAIGTRKGLLTYQESNGQWNIASESHLGARVSYAIRDTRSGLLFACLDHGHWGAKLQRSRDDGKTWEEIPAPKYPEGAELKDDKPAVLRYQWCLEPGAATQPGRLYMGTEPGGLFVSDNDGDSFELVESLWNHDSRKELWVGGGLDEPGIHSILVDPRDPQRISVGVSVAGVFLTTDGGQTWHPRNTGLKADFMPNPDVEIGHDPHLVVQCADHPDVLWQQNHCGIFRSTDGAETWTRVSEPGASTEDDASAFGTAHFGFAIAVDPHDGETAWVIPAVSDEVRVAIDRKLCVCRTTDGGRSWVAFHEGLPQSDCYDFAFRHSLDLSGDRLVFGTACGSLYLSNDRGETWRVLANHLPPIYSVRFV
jgi:photosystem II stability/assembly factor-like uncharacterized protein